MRDKNIVGKLKTVPVPRKLPVVLSREEVSRLLEAICSLKYKAAFSVALYFRRRMKQSNLPVSNRELPVRVEERNRSRGNGCQPASSFY